MFSVWANLYFRSRKIYSQTTWIWLRCSRSLKGFAQLPHQLYQSFSDYFISIKYPNNRQNRWMERSRWRFHPSLERKAPNAWIYSSEHWQMVRQHENDHIRKCCSPSSVFEKYQRHGWVTQNSQWRYFVLWILLAVAKISCSKSWSVKSS